MKINLEPSPDYAFVSDGDLDDREVLGTVELLNVNDDGKVSRPPLLRYHLVKKTPIH